MPSTQSQYKTEILAQLIQLLIQQDWSAASSKLLECPAILYWLAESQDWKNIHLILTHCHSIDINATSSEETSSISVLWLIAFHKQRDLFNLAIKRCSNINFNVKPNCGEKQNQTILRLIALEEWWEELEFIIKTYPHLDLSSQQVERNESISFTTPILYLALEAKQEQILKTLFDFHPLEFYRNLLLILIYDSNLLLFKAALNAIKNLEINLDINYSPYGNDQYDSDIAPYFYVKSEKELLGITIGNGLGIRIHVHPPHYLQNLELENKRIKDTLDVINQIKEQFPKIEGSKKITGEGRFQGVSLFWSLAYMDQWEFLYNWLNENDELTVDLNSFPSLLSYKQQSFFSLLKQAAIKDEHYACKLLSLILKRDVALDAGNVLTAILTDLSRLSHREILSNALKRMTNLTPYFMLGIPSSEIKDSIFFLKSAFENPVSLQLRELVLPIEMIEEEILSFLPNLLARSSIEKISFLQEGKYQELGFEGVYNIEKILQNNRLKNINYKKACELIELSDRGNALSNSEAIITYLSEAKEQYKPLAGYTLVIFCKEIINHLDFENASYVINNIMQGLFLIFIENFCYDIGVYLFLVDSPDKRECYWQAACFLSEAIGQMQGNDERFVEAQRFFVESLLVCAGMFNNLNKNFDFLKSHADYLIVLHKLIEKKQAQFYYPEYSNIEKLPVENLQDFNVRLISCLDAYSLCQLISISHLSQFTDKNFLTQAKEIKSETRFFQKIAPDCQKWVQENLMKNDNNNSPSTPSSTL